MTTKSAEIDVVNKNRRENGALPGEPGAEKGQPAGLLALRRSGTPGGTESGFYKKATKLTKMGDEKGTEIATFNTEPAEGTENCLTRETANPARN